MKPLDAIIKILDIKDSLKIWFSEMLKYIEDNTNKKVFSKPCTFFDMKIKDTPFKVSFYISYYLYRIDGHSQWWAIDLINFKLLKWDNVEQIINFPNNAICEFYDSILDIIINNIKDHIVSESSKITED